jgi:hypothetical protein
VSFHRVPETGVALGDRELCLAGALADGTRLLGCDAVRTVPPHGATPTRPASAGRPPAAR